MTEEEIQKDAALEKNAIENAIETGPKQGMSEGTRPRKKANQSLKDPTAREARADHDGRKDYDEAVPAEMCLKVRDPSSANPQPKPTAINGTHEEHSSEASTKTPMD